MRARQLYAVGPQKSVSATQTHKRTFLVVVLRRQMISVALVNIMLAITRIVCAHRRLFIRNIEIIINLILLLVFLLWPLHRMRPMIIHLCRIDRSIVDTLYWYIVRLAMPAISIRCRNRIVIVCISMRGCTFIGRFIIIIITMGGNGGGCGADSDSGGYGVGTVVDVIVTIHTIGIDVAVLVLATAFANSGIMRRMSRCSAKRMLLMLLCDRCGHCHRYVFRLCMDDV